jgi:hypothetical protein
LWIKENGSIMALYKNTNKFAKEFTILNWMFFFNIAEEPIPFLKRRWAIEESDGTIREFTFGLQKITKKGITFRSFYLGPFILSWGKIHD